MNSQLLKMIERWRAHRNRMIIRSPYNGQYAFVGAGNHALQNLFPVIQYLGVPLKYICCRSADKIPLLERRFGVVATTSLDTVLMDDEVKGVFVCTSPQSHYGLCSRILASGKHVFVEKPPCVDSRQLAALISADRNKMIMAGMQKRYSPYVRTLVNRLAKHAPRSYTMIYHTGAYPEGDAFTDLFIHPVDLASYLFGRAEIGHYQRFDTNGTATVQLMLLHGKVTGFIEMSTAYTWSDAHESLRINTAGGEYHLENMERLSYHPNSKIIAGIPIEKAGLFTPAVQILAARNNFNPVASNNQLYSQGFLSEIKAFADMVEFNEINMSPLSDLTNTYGILEGIF